MMAVPVPLVEAPTLDKAPAAKVHRCRRWEAPGAVLNMAGPPLGPVPAIRRRQRKGQQRPHPKSDQSAEQEDLGEGRAPIVPATSRGEAVHPQRLQKPRPRWKRRNHRYRRQASEGKGEGFNPLQSRENRFSVAATIAEMLAQAAVAGVPTTGEGARSRERRERGGRGRGAGAACGEAIRRRWWRGRTVGGRGEGWKRRLGSRAGTSPT